MEFLAFVALALLFIVGWVVCDSCLPVITPVHRFYFAPAIGVPVCGIVGYVAVRIFQPWIVPIFCLLILIIFVIRSRTLLSFSLNEEDAKLLRFTLLVVLCFYTMQAALYSLFSRFNPGPHEVWSLFNLTGVPPPDQMFAWHQAMFFDQHRHYPTDPFYADMDLYDRPHLGGYVTLFFFKLFNFPLTEDSFTYPANSLRFYHCFWWMLDDLYLLGLAPLFKLLFGLRGAVTAIAATALGGFFFICNTGGWVKFAAAYFVLLAFVLFVNSKAFLLQAIFCTLGYYMHGAVLPFLAGFGILQLLQLRYPTTARLNLIRNVAIFGTTSLVLIGAWFLNVHYVGSKQPLFYYYLYGAGLTEAQTRPVRDIAQAFYSSHSWGTLSFLPIYNLYTSIAPIAFFQSLRSFFWLNAPLKLSDLATALFASQRFCIECALGLVAAPLIIYGLFTFLRQKYSGRVVLALYLVPTIIIAIVYRTAWPFGLQITFLYHTLVLVVFVYASQRLNNRWLLAFLVAIAVEGIICVLFSDVRLLPVKPLQLDQLTSHEFRRLVIYFVLLLVILILAAVHLTEAPTDLSGASSKTLQNNWTVAGKLAVGCFVFAGVVAIYSVYLLQFYH